MPFFGEAIQYLRPHGKWILHEIELPDEVFKKYEEIIGRGWNLAAEVLTTNEVSATIEDREKGIDRAIRVFENKPDNLRNAYVEMLNELIP